MVADFIGGLFSFLAELIFRVLIEFFFFYTGEVILSIITFGRKKIRLDWYSGTSVTRWMLLTDFSVFIGILFWGLLFFLIKN